VLIDQILPDTHRVAAPRQLQLDHLPIRFTGSGRALVTLLLKRHVRQKAGITSLAGFELSAALEPEKPVITSMAGFELEEPVVTEVAAFAGGFRPSLPATVMLSRPTSNNRQPSRDGLPSPPRSDAGTNQDAPARSPAPASLFPRHYPCQQRLISPAGANVLGRFSMAGFEVIIYGRFWVIAEVRRPDDIQATAKRNFA